MVTILRMLLTFFLLNGLKARLHYSIHNIPICRSCNDSSSHRFWNAPSVPPVKPLEGLLTQIQLALRILSCPLTCMQDYYGILPVMQLY